MYHYIRKRKNWVFLKHFIKLKIFLNWIIFYFAVGYRTKENIFELKFLHKRDQALDRYCVKTVNKRHCLFISCL